MQGKTKQQNKGKSVEGKSYPATSSLLIGINSTIQNSEFLGDWQTAEFKIS
jgi:hypothetical protein